ncbi:MAG: 2-amino-4-hydroxy-6-hydroxymethyldihydropteridine diphosphokinase [Chloroflexi bacterium]|nr:2-amino-4-hydroxy-6-hydroxymethyldihydropteridine diphosphokinase [Chloroflexota bacterium]
MPLIYLGLGSNLGDRELNLSKAVELLSRFATVSRISSLYETEPAGYRDQPDFLNAACRIASGLGPKQLLVLLKGIETFMGRKPGFRNAPRTVDIDILIYDDLVLNTAGLQIPHPRLTERAFVLEPLAEIAPGLVHPLARKTITRLLEDVGGRATVHLWKRREKTECLPFPYASTSTPPTT